MKESFAKKLKLLRTQRDISQSQLARQMFVTQSTIARWESGNRLPDAVMISRLSKCLNVDVNTLLSAAAESNDAPNIIIVDDVKAVLSTALRILEEAIPNGVVVGFSRPSEAIAYAQINPVSLAFLDIELGKSSGLDLCSTLLNINPRTNIVFLTAYSNYSLDAWNTKASGFMLKPITLEGVRVQLKNLRYPFMTGGADV